jgi:hypothetical protein
VHSLQDVIHILYGLELNPDVLLIITLIDQDVRTRRGLISLLLLPSVLSLALTSAVALGVQLTRVEVTDRTIVVLYPLVVLMVDE